jgi:hypothetical protein
LFFERVILKEIHLIKDVYGMQFGGNNYMGGLNSSSYSPSQTSPNAGVYNRNEELLAISVFPFE